KHQELHSFPTRRSSDLQRYRQGKERLTFCDHRIEEVSNVDVKVNDEIQMANDESMTNDEAGRFRHSGFVILSSLVIGASSFLLRSEEHTSELQSPCNLV